MLVFLISALLLQCGDIELNPGPKANKTKKTEETRNIGDKKIWVIATMFHKVLDEREDTKGAVCSIQQCVNKNTTNIQFMKEEHNKMKEKVSFI